MCVWLCMVAERSEIAQPCGNDGGGKEGEVRRVQVAAASGRVKRRVREAREEDTKKTKKEL